MKKITRIPIILLVLALTSLACNFGLVPTDSNLGSVGGIITAEGGEGLLDGVIVTLSGCTEDMLSISDANGYFEFIGVPAGICVLEVSKGGWEYASADPEAGYPIPVVVEEGSANALTIYMRSAEASAAQPAAIEPTATGAPTDTLPTATPDVTATPSAPMVTPIDQDVNCRFGPGIKYYASDALFVGNTVPILGRTSDSNWWQVEGPRHGYGNCFIAANVTQTSGDLSNVPVVSAPAAFVTAVTAYAKVNKGLVCPDPHHLVMSGTITTNGPATVEYRWWFKDLNTGNVEYGNYETITFSEYGDKTVNFETYLSACADVEVQLQVNKPNQIAGKDNFSIEFP